MDRRPRGRPTRLGEEDASSKRSESANIGPGFETAFPGADSVNFLSTQSSSMSFDFDRIVSLDARHFESVSELTTER